MIEMPLKFSSDFRTNKQEASPVGHDSASVLEQNQTTDLFFFFFFPKLHLKHKKVQVVIPADELVLTGECVNH